MNRSDRRRWAGARTLAEVGELTAQWIEGKLSSQPGYCGPGDIEDPAMVPVLTALCRAGFVTTGSQAGFDGTGYDGAHWQQRAAVEGFVRPGVALMLDSLAEVTGLTCVIYPAPSRWRYGYGRSVTVTRREGEHRTGFAVHLPYRHIRSSITGYGICHRDAVKALREACQVTLIDPQWGREDRLWAVLATFAGSLT